MVMLPTQISSLTGPFIALITGAADCGMVPTPALVVRRISR